MLKLPQYFRQKRSSLLFLAGLSLAAILAITLDGQARYALGSGLRESELTQAPEFVPLPPRALTRQDFAAAQRAWAYFQQNTRPETGLTDSVAGFPSTTLWDQGSYLFALVAAQGLGLIELTEFHNRADRLLRALQSAPLFEATLPNKAYDTRSLQTVDYANLPVEEGIGWSALDMARLLAAFRVLEQHWPEYGVRLRETMSGWDLNALAHSGELWGATRFAGETRNLQEGRIGYEQYGARSVALWGLDAMRAASAFRTFEWRDINGINVAIDLRKAADFKAITPVLSEPYLLQAFEIGLDTEGRLFASRVYQAQHARYVATGQLTMVSEDHLDRAPSFVYNSVFANGQDWAVISEDGTFHQDLRTISTKAVIGWDVLYQTPYTEMLRAMIDDIGDTEKGWPAGLYESDNGLNAVYSLNTNAVILEALYFKAFGPLMSPQG